MPFYDYQCTKCKHIEEEFRSIAMRDAEGVCKICGGSTHRVIEAPEAVVFHGSGFYVTDHRGDQKKSGGKE